MWSLCFCSFHWILSKLSRRVDLCCRLGLWLYNKCHVQYSESFYHLPLSSFLSLLLRHTVMQSVGQSNTTLPFVSGRTEVTKMSSTRRFLYICSSKLTERQYFLQVLNVLLPLGSFVKCCCMFLWVGLAVFVELFMYILPPDLWFQSLTVFLCWCFIFLKRENFFLSAACQTYCISKDVKVYFSFWKTIKYHHVRKKLLVVSSVISVSSPHFMQIKWN